MDNILVITDKLYPDEIGGSCIYAYETIINLQNKNNVDIFTCYPEKNNNDFNGRVYRDFNKKRPIKSSLKLLKIINENKYDVVLFHSIYSWFIYYIIKPFIKSKLKQVTIFHGPWHKEAELKYESKNQKFKKIFLVYLMKKITYKYVNDNENYIFLSNYMKDELLKINGDLNKKRYEIIPGGVNYKNYTRKYSKEEAKKLLGIEKNKFVIFTLRRLELRMGIQNAIDAIDILDSDYRENTILIIGGKGEYENKLKEKAKKSQGNIRFEGFIPDEKINLYFCASDLFLVPTLDLEGFGLVNLESLAMGVPVLATPQGGMIDLARLFNNFYICNENSAISIAKHIQVLGDKFKNKVTYEEEIINYSWDKIVDKMEIFIKNID